MDTQDFVKRVEANTQAVMSRIFGQARSSVKALVSGHRSRDQGTGTGTDTSSVSSILSANSILSAKTTMDMSNAFRLQPDLNRPFGNPQQTIAFKTPLTAKLMENCGFKDTARSRWGFENKSKKTTTTTTMTTVTLPSPIVGSGGQPKVKAMVAQLNGGALPVSHSPARGDLENGPVADQSKGGVTKSKFSLLRSLPVTEGTRSPPSGLFRNRVRPSSPRRIDSQVSAPATAPMEQVACPREGRDLRDADEDDKCSFIELVRVPTQNSVRSFRFSETKVPPQETTPRTWSPLFAQGKHAEASVLKGDSDDDDDGPLQYLDVGPCHGRNVLQRNVEQNFEGDYARVSL